MENLQQFIQASNLYRKFAVDDLLFAEFKCPYDDSKSGIWWHNNFFAYVLAGETLMQTPEQKYVLRPGDIVFARKGSVLTMSQTHEDFCEILVFVPDAFIKTVVQKYQLNLPVVGNVAGNNTVIPLSAEGVLKSYFQSLLDYFSLARPPAEQLLRLKFEELLVHLISARRSLPLLCYFNDVCSSVKPSIRDMMEANFYANLTISEFARMCSRSTSAFKREFRSIYGISPGRWLKEKRLEYSKYLLETTQMNISEICAECGFTNRSHFHRAFKDKYRITPGQLVKK